MILKNYLVYFSKLNQFYDIFTGNRTIFKVWAKETFEKFSELISEYCCDVHARPLTPTSPSQGPHEHRVAGTVHPGGRCVAEHECLQAQDAISAAQCVNQLGFCGTNHQGNAIADLPPQYLLSWQARTLDYCH